MLIWFLHLTASNRKGSKLTFVVLSESNLWTSQTVDHRESVMRFAVVIPQELLLFSISIVVELCY
jgi:hypothetical protein